jgi:hypothetical protein
MKSPETTPVAQTAKDLGPAARRQTSEKDERDASNLTTGSRARAT